MLLCALLIISLTGVLSYRNGAGGYQYHYHNRPKLVPYETFNYQDGAFDNGNMELMMKKRAKSDNVAKSLQNFFRYIDESPKKAEENLLKTANNQYSSQSAAASLYDTPASTPGVLNAQRTSLQSQAVNAGQQSTYGISPRAAISNAFQTRSQSGGLTRQSYPPVGVSSQETPDNPYNMQTVNSQQWGNMQQASNHVGDNFGHNSVNIPPSYVNPESHNGGYALGIPPNQQRFPVPPAKPLKPSAYKLTRNKGAVVTIIGKTPRVPRGLGAKKSSGPISLDVTIHGNIRPRVGWSGEKKGFKKTPKKNMKKKSKKNHKRSSIDRKKFEMMMQKHICKNEKKDATLKSATKKNGNKSNLKRANAGKKIDKKVKGQKAGGKVQKKSDIKGNKDKGTKGNIKNKKGNEKGKMQKRKLVTGTKTDKKSDKKQKIQKKGGKIVVKKNPPKNKSNLKKAKKPNKKPKSGKGGKSADQDDEEDEEENDGDEDSDDEEDDD